MSDSSSVINIQVRLMYLLLSMYAMCSFCAVFKLGIRIQLFGSRNQFDSQSGREPGSSSLFSTLFFGRL